MFSVIDTPNAPSAIGPYVQAVDTGLMVFVSGQLPINPKTNQFPADIGQQTMQSLNNIKMILASCDIKISNIIKTTVFIKNMDQFPIVNELYKEFFMGNNSGFPARSCVEVARLPKDALIEIEAIAIRG